MNNKQIKGYSIVLLLCLLNISCEDFVEVETPNNKLISEEVFNSEATAKSAMIGIYNELFQASFSGGSRNSVTVLAALSSDNLKNINTTNLSRMEFQQNEISADNLDNLDLWSSAYSIIYMTNSFLEGLEKSNQITIEVKNQLEGEARFVRAFTYFYMVNLYGDIPLILSTDFGENQLAERTTKSEIYNQILVDLITATGLLNSDYRNGDRSHVNDFAAKALLARVYLYLEDWSEAESLSSEVIDKIGTYEILDNPEDVFLANSKEAIWQISPIGGGGIVTHTNEGALFLIDPFFSFFASLKLENNLISSFDENDKRLLSWVDYNSDKDAYFPTKYKVEYSTSFPIQEYSMVLRLAEQYLIRAEARVHLSDLAGAIEDLDVIRARAGVDLIAETTPEISGEDLLELILIERKKELYTEWGHRWLDLKRLDLAGEVLGTENSFWENTDVLYPIPSDEIMKNPNLSQNPGY